MINLKEKSSVNLYKINIKHTIKYMTILCNYLKQSKIVFSIPL